MTLSAAVHAAPTSLQPADTLLILQRVASKEAQAHEGCSTSSSLERADMAISTAEPGDGGMARGAPPVPGHQSNLPRTVQRTPFACCTPAARADQAPGVQVHLSAL